MIFNLVVAPIYQNIGSVVLMFLLLVGSAFFSAAETAFFNLSRRQINLLQKSKHRLQRLAAALLARPGRLLGCLLLANMTVNVLFYTISSVLALRAEQQIGAAAATACAFLAFISLVLFGEILPKSLAYANSRTVSLIAALPVAVWLRIFAPLHFVLRFFIVEPTLRLTLGPAKLPEPVTPGEFKLLIEQVRKRGLITDDENKLLTEIIELGFLKVRHVMRPRVDMIACRITDSTQKARELMQENHLTRLAVYRRTIDNIVGLVSLRRLLLEPDSPLAELIQQVHFVPEQTRLESLLEFFRRTATDTAIVVDEYGGIAGSVCLTDIAEELLGPIEAADGIELIEQIGPLKYRLAGNLAIHDWAEAFGIDPAQTRISTVAGLVTTLLGKIPEAGDVARLKNLSFTVERVRKRRIETIVLTLEPILDDS